MVKSTTTFVKDTILLYVGKLELSFFAETAKVGWKIFQFKGLVVQLKTILLSQVIARKNKMSILLSMIGSGQATFLKKSGFIVPGRK